MSFCNNVSQKCRRRNYVLLSILPKELRKPGNKRRSPSTHCCVEIYLKDAKTGSVSSFVRILGPRKSHCQSVFFLHFLSKKNLNSESTAPNKDWKVSLMYSRSIKVRIKLLSLRVGSVQNGLETQISITRPFNNGGSE